MTKASERPPRDPRGLRVLGASDVDRLLDPATACELQRDAYATVASGAATMAPNQFVRVPGGVRWMKLLAAYDGPSGVLAVKALARSIDPQAVGVGSLVLLFDSHDGTPVALVNGAGLTLLRTAAGCAVATAALAAGPVERLALIGSGNLARRCVDVFAATFPSLQEVRVYSRSPERREALAADARERHRLTGVAGESVAAAVDGADVIITATDAKETVLARDHVQPGQHLNALGLRAEIDPEIVAAATVVPDSPQEVLVEGAFSLALEQGLVERDQLGPPLGELLAGTAQLRRDDDDITLFDCSGLAIQDAVCAIELLRRAAAEDAGVLAEL